jgi:hypothetical protein
MENCKCVATALNNIAAMNLSGAIDKGQWEKVVMDYFQEDDFCGIAHGQCEPEWLDKRAKQAVQTKRKLHRTSYLMKGIAVCCEAFIHVHG